MATELIGGAFISASIQLLLEKIASPEVVNYLLGRKNSNFDALLKKLKLMVTSLTLFLDDAEQRQIRDDPRVVEWLDGVQEAVFDAEDLLDEIATDALRLKAEAESSSGGRGPKRKRMFHFLSRTPADSKIELRVSKVIERLEDIARQTDLLGLREAIVEQRKWQRLPSTSLVEETEVYGRDEDKDAIIQLLLRDDVGRENICVIPIAGMGGVGKTTVAQAVFNDERLKDHFQFKAWVHVSEEFDVFRVTSSLLQSDSPHDSKDLNSLQVQLRDKLDGLKFLIVLDDVWNENYLQWDALRMPFKGGARGSKVIVSTRSDKVASIVGSVPTYQLRELADEACWKIFVKHASGVGDFTKDPELGRLGREIIQKCNGLPLAVKTLGGVLRSTLDVREWERVSKSDLWELSDVQSKILPALRLSYYYLPSPLKRCFAYCAIFPKNYKFDKEELILLWMAENLLEYPKRNWQQLRRMEDVGDEYFNGLLSRSFFQQSTTRTNFVMHDLLVDLAKSVSRKYCLHSENTGSLDNVPTAQARYFTYTPGYHDHYERFSPVLRATHLRTIFPVRQMFTFFLCKNVVDDLVHKLRRLRVLSFAGHKSTTEVPNSIGELRHLRYLNLSATSISSLPESLTALLNLQTLRLAFCIRLTELPKDLHRLTKLRYLELSSSGLRELPESLSLLSDLQTLKLTLCRSLTKLPTEFHRLENLRKLELAGSGLEGMPTQISELKSLETLSTFVVGKDIGAKIGELKGLSNLGGTLHIKNLQNVIKPDEASEARLRDKKYLDGLQLEWDKRSGSASKYEMDVLDNLLPNTSLKKLEFICYRDTEFPNWLGDRSFTNIVDMSLSNCSHCLSLPPLGELPSLKNLQIKGFNSVARVGPEFYGKSYSNVEPFPSLEVLEIKQMPNWRVWSASDQDSEAFPKLRKLTIESCGGLKGDLPRFLPSLTELTISMCDELVPPLPAMPNLSKLELKMCENLGSVIKPHVLNPFNRLQHLKVSADSLSIRLKSLPLSLKTLNIQSSRCLELEIQQSADSLEELSIECKDEGSFQPFFVLDSFPNIRKLCFIGCKNLESLWPSSTRSLQSLSTLDISNCHDSTLLPKNGIPFPSLTTLTVINCRELKLLSEELNIVVPTLESLTIRACPLMESFSKSGIPSTLRRLVLSECDALVSSRMKWNLQRLGDLQCLIIGECEWEDMESFPEEGLLPASLTELSIWYIDCLTTLNNEWLRQLTSLKQLTVYDCHNLRDMVGPALPSSLESLRITSCPLLQRKFEKGVGECWNKISHVPWIYIDYKLL